MEIFAFRGTRYHPAIGDPGRLAAPPFDQIDSKLATELRTEPHHFAQLTRPDPAAEDPHLQALETQSQWLEDGVLVEEESPALYLYETQLTTGGSRLGLCALIGLGAGDVRPHEQTVSKTVDERLDLIRKIETDLEPIFLLCNDEGTLEAELAADHDGAQWLASYRDEFGHMHSIAAIQDPDRIEDYKELLRSHTALIADGHHRHKVAGLYAEEIEAKPGTAAAAKLVVLVSLSSPHLTIDPIHRAVRSAVDLEPIRPFLQEVHPWQGQTGSGLALAVATARQPAIGIWEVSGDPQICTLDTEKILARANGSLPDLPVTLFHSLFEELGWDEKAASDGTLIYRSDPDKLYREMVTKEFEQSFWLPPMSADGFSQALTVCDLLPPKSTRFLPKLASGLVWARHNCELL